MKQIQPFQKHWLQLTSIVVCRLNPLWISDAIWRHGSLSTLVQVAIACFFRNQCFHYNDVIMSTIASQITSLMNVFSTVYSDADQRKHQSSASLAFVRGIHRGPVNSPHKWQLTRKMFPFDDVIMLHHQYGPVATRGQFDWKYKRNH